MTARHSKDGVPVAERTPKDGPEEGYRVDVPVPVAAEKDTFVKHYVVSGEGETDCTNDMLDSALRLGLRPVGDAKRVGAEDHPGGTAKVVTWSIPVHVPEGRGDVLAPRDDAEKAEG